MEKNENKVRLSGTLNLNRGLVLGKEYDITISNAECRKSTQSPNDDGTYDEIYNLIVSSKSIINIISENDIVTGSKGSQSQILRMWIRKLGAKKAEYDLDEFYQKTMSKIINKIKEECEN